MNHHPYTMAFQARDHVNAMVDDARRYRLVRASRDDGAVTQAHSAPRRWRRWTAQLVLDLLRKASKTPIARPDPTH
jgi:hypothetical protein